MSDSETLVKVEDLKMYFPVLAGVMRRKVGDVRAIDGVSFDIKNGETLGLVGESGCGKTTTGRCILQLYDITSGKITFQGQEISSMPRRKLRPIRKDMQLIFQDPYASLDPRMTAGTIVGEPLKVHAKNEITNKKEYQERVDELFRLVQLAPYMTERYPHEFSGGQRQRLGIARALATRPKLIVCDEPVSALDVSIQTQVISLLIRLREEFNLTYVFIAHDLSVVRHISDRVAVMYLGKIVEITSSDELYDHPLHPYTQALLSAVPIPDPKIDRLRKRILLTGDVPSPMRPPPGCTFNPRCPMAIDRCREEIPIGREVGSGHWVACHRV